jgi:Uma2 family endonuclease
MAAVATIPAFERSVILEDIRWETYERLLAENNPGRGKRFTYDNGTLQIMVLSRRHERANRLLASIVEQVSVEWGLDIARGGSLTVKRADLLKGFEPDSSFYIRNASTVLGKEELDFALDPPPDLVIEVDITSDSMNKFPIFGAVGVPEVWRFDGRQVSIHLLRGSRYVDGAKSEALSPLTSDLLTGFLLAGFENEGVNWTLRIREWAQSVTRS